MPHSEFDVFRQVAITDWAEHYSEEHSRAYWQNLNTGELTWIQPADGNKAAAANPLEDTTPTSAITGTTANPVHGTQHNSNQSGWTEHWNAMQYSAFWTNDSTGESTWHRPDDIAT